MSPTTQSAHLAHFSHPFSLQEHVKCILEHRDVDLDVRNSSGQDAAGVAATCGRESLISHLLVRRNLEQRRMKPSFKDQHRLAQLQHRQLPLGTRRALRARARTRRSRRKSTSSELSPSHNDTDHLHAHRMSVTAEASILCQGKSETLENRRVCAITDGVPVAPKHTSGTENTAGLLVEAQDDGTDHDAAAQHADNESRSNKIGDKNSHCLAACEPLQPPSDTTRAIAVQTDPEVLQARDMQEIAVAAPASPQPAAGFRASGILHHPPLGRIPEGARLQRRSTAPGDLFSVSRRFKRPRPLPTESEEDVGGREVHARQRIAGASPGTNETTLTMEVDRGRAPVSGTTEHDLSGLCSEGTVFRTDLRQIEIEASSAVAPTDERGEPPARDTPHGAANVGDLASQQQQMPAPSGCLDDSGLVAVDAGSPPGAVDPSLERRNKVDEVTRELQRLLREDALQDDGGW